MIAGLLLGETAAGQAVGRLTSGKPGLGGRTRTASRPSQRAPCQSREACHALERREAWHALAVAKHQEARGFHVLCLARLLKIGHVVRPEVLLPNGSRPRCIFVGSCSARPRRGSHAASTSGGWECRVLVPSGLTAVVVPTVGYLGELSSIPARRRRSRASFSVSERTGCPAAC